MPYETFSSGLTIQAPTAGTKNWAETLRTQLFAKISAHDHTGSGKGLQIATAALATNAVTTVKITDLNVTTAKINDLAVTTAKLADGAVTTAKVVDLNITTGKINDLAITAGKIASDAVTTAKILNSNVTTDKINDLAVTTAKLADSSVTAAKLATSISVRSQIGAFSSAVSTVGGTDQRLPVVDGGSFSISMPVAGTVSHLSIGISNIGASQDIVCKVFKNGSDTSQSVTISAGATTTSGALGTPVSFAANDTIDIRVSYSALAANRNIWVLPFGTFTA